jgi:mono/diheme cytochrome c family protein
MLRTALIGLLVGLAAPAFAQDPAAITRGEQVFAAQKCTVCHMVAGKGNKNGPLDGIGLKHTAEELRQWVTDAPTMAAKIKAERKPPMKAFVNIPPADLDDLVAFLQSLKKP